MANNRRRAREYALKVLYALKYEHEQVNPDLVLAHFWNNFHFSDDPLGEPLEVGTHSMPQAVKLFTENLVRGVIIHRAVLDEQITTSARNWSLSRMAPVDLALLRMATYELMFLPDTPPAVILNEAIEIAKSYGTGESPAFVNGLLDKIAHNLADSSKGVDRHIDDGDVT